MTTATPLLEPWWAEYGFDDAPPMAEPPDEAPDEVPAWLLAGPVVDREPSCDCFLDEFEPEVAAEPDRAADPDPDADYGPDAEPVRWAVPGVWDEPATVGPARVGPLVGQLQELVARLGEVDAALLPAGQALAEAEALLGVMQRLRVQQLARTVDVSDRQLFARHGFRSTAAWWRHAGPDAAETDRTLAPKLTRRRHLRAAVHTGQVSLLAAGKVATALGTLSGALDRPDGLIDGQPAEPVITAVVTNVVDLVCRDRCGLSPQDPAQAALLAQVQRRTAAIVAGGGSQADRVEQALVLLAELISPGNLPGALEELAGALLPNSLEQQDKAARDNRGASLNRRPDGSWHLEATLTPECGERLFTALAAEARRDPANPVDTAIREQQRTEAAQAQGRDRFTHPDPVPAWETDAVTAFGGTEELVPRSRSKRLHDALDRLLTRYLGSGLGGTHDKVPVQFTLTVPAALVDGQPGALPGRGPSGRPLARSLLRRLWCDSTVTSVLLSTGWTPLGIAHHGRTHTAAERTATQVQFDNRCAGDGCCPGHPDPLIPLVPHHVIKHAIAGRTSLTETLLACPTLHHDLHTGKKTIRLRDGRLINENGFVTDSK